MNRITQPATARAVGTVVVLGALVMPATASLAAVSPAASPPPMSAVGEWNLYAIDALGNPPDAQVPGAGQYPLVQLVHLAMVQGAVYDAVNAIDGGYEPYLTDLADAPPDASLDAAVATAAHDVLVGLVAEPALPDAAIERLDALYAADLIEIPDGAAETAGIAAGADAAAAMLAARAEDGRFAATSFTVGDQPGEWRPMPGEEDADGFTWLADVDPFTLDSPSQFRTAGPLAVTSAEYAAEYDEVMNLGGVDGARDEEQQAVADFFVVNPVELYNRTFRTVASVEGLEVVEEARLLAMADVAGADAVINCWSDKQHWSSWRPVTAIHEGDDDGNDATVGDPDWEPLGHTPPYPDHTSGYNCITSSMIGAADAFFGGEPVGFTLVRIVPDAPEVTRDYVQFTDVVDDTIDARVFQGIHFRSADVQGAEIGANVAEWVAAQYFQPMS